MKLKLIVKIVEKLLGMNSSDDAPRADMYLPERLLAIALVALLGGVGCGVYAAFSFAVWAVVCAPLGIVLGVMALLCWKNQSIRVISDEQFTYTTMFGNTTTYCFADIRGLRKNQDSMTLFVAGQKVHIESMAVLSPRLINLINTSLQKQR